MPVEHSADLGNPAGVNPILSRSPNNAYLATSIHKQVALRSLEACVIEDEIVQSVCRSIEAEWRRNYGRDSIGREFDWKIQRGWTLFPAFEG